MQYYKVVSICIIRPNPLPSKQSDENFTIEILLDESIEILSKLNVREILTVTVHVLEMFFHSL
jgi:hypothetical protein